MSVFHIKKNLHDILNPHRQSFGKQTLWLSDRDRWREESGQPARSVWEQNVRGEMKREGERRVSGEHKYRVETKHSVWVRTDSTNTKVVQLLKKEQREKKWWEQEKKRTFWLSQRATLWCVTEEQERWEKKKQVKKREKKRTFNALTEWSTWRDYTTWIREEFKEKENR